MSDSLVILKFLTRSVEYQMCFGDSEKNSIVWQMHKSMYEGVKQLEELENGITVEKN